jgi:hypothetical protein
VLSVNALPYSTTQYGCIKTDFHLPRQFLRDYNCGFITLHYRLQPLAVSLDPLCELQLSGVRHEPQASAAQGDYAHLPTRQRQLLLKTS